MNKEPLICIRDCDPINHLNPSYWIDEGSLIERYQCDEISLFIIKDGFHLIYNKDHFMALSEYRETKIDKICG